MLVVSAAGLTTAWMAHPENTSGDLAATPGADRLMALLATKETSKDVLGGVGAVVGTVVQHRRGVSDAFLKLFGRTLYQSALTRVHVAELDTAVAYLLRLGDREDNGGLGCMAVDGVEA